MKTQHTTSSLNPSIYLLAMLPPLFWAGNFILGKWISTTIPPVQLSLYRWLVALIILGFITHKALIQHYKTICKEFKTLFFFALFGITGFNVLVYLALHHTTAINGALINSTMPIITLVLSGVILKERFSLQQYIGISISIFGLLTIFSAGNYALFLQLKFNQGDIFVLLGVSCWALYTVLIKRWISQLPFFVFLFSIVFIGCLLHIPLLLIEIPRLGWAVFTTSSWAVIAYLAIFPSILAYFYWGKVIHLLGPSRASLFMYLMPLFSVLLASLFLQENLYNYHFLGFIFIILGLFLVNKSI